MEIGKTRAEEGTGFLEGIDTPCHKKLCKDPVNAKLRSKTADFFRIGRIFEYPFLL